MQRKIRLTPVRLLALGYLCVIIIVTILLILPFSSKITGSAAFALSSAASAASRTEISFFCIFCPSSNAVKSKIPIVFTAFSLNRSSAAP